MLEEIMTLIAEHQWVPLAALIVGAVVRLLKSDTKLPITVPARWRALAAVILGEVGAVLAHVMGGVPLGEAVLGGLGAAFTAIAGHGVIVEGLFGGREVPVPGMMKSSKASSKTLSVLLVLCVLPGCWGCAGSFEEARSPRVTISAAVTDRCSSLDDGHRNWSATAKGSAVLAGASGLSTIPLDNRDAQIALAASSAALAGVAAFAQIQADGFSESWARECSGQ